MFLNPTLMQIVKIQSKDADSLMWTGTPIPKNLKELAATGAPIVGNAFTEKNCFFLIRGGLHDL